MEKREGKEMSRFSVTGCDELEGKEVLAACLADVHFAVLALREDPIAEFDDNDAFQRWLSSEGQGKPKKREEAAAAGKVASAKRMREAEDEMKASEEQARAFRNSGVSVREFFRSVADEETVSDYFAFNFTGGHGYQWGNPHHEWRTVTVSEATEEKKKKKKGASVTIASRSE